MVGATFSTISMVTSLRFPENMSLLFALWEEVLMVLFGKQKSPFFLVNFAEFVCFVVVFWCKGLSLLSDMLCFFDLLELLD